MITLLNAKAGENLFVNLAYVMAKFKQQRVLNQAIRSAYIIWAKRYPHWTTLYQSNAQFDESFLRGVAYPLIVCYAEGILASDPKPLVKLWVEHFNLSDEECEQVVERFTPAVDDYLHLVKSEYALM